jgi:hypothetical protein
LPYLAPFTMLPRGLMLAIGVGLNALAAVSICRSLAAPRLMWPFVLCWPPVIEGVWVANIQVVLVALFLWIFWGGEPHGPWRPRLRMSGRGARESSAHGVGAAVIAAIKVSQVHPWLLVLRERPAAAIRGAAVVGLFVLGTLPLTGPDLYRSWLYQLTLASDSGWVAAGSPISSIIGGAPAIALTALTVPIALLLPRYVGALSPVWIGLLVIVAAPNIHPYYFLFMCPAMLLVRREIALVAAVLIASYWPGTEWISFAIVAGSLALGHIWEAVWEHSASPSMAAAPASSTRGESVVPHGA